MASQKAPVDLRIEVEGLKETQAALRAVDDKLPRELRKVNKTAADLVRDAAKAKAPVLTGHLRDSLTSRAEQRGASIKGGGDRVPYYGFIDFGNVVGKGAAVGRGDSVPREFLRRGRIIYPALAEKRDEVTEQHERMMTDLLRDAGLR